MSDSGGHWYLRDGTPSHQVRARDGSMRGFNLRWDRKLKAVPSVTTILGVIAKPALENWKVEQGILSALTLPRIEGEEEQKYLDRVKDDSKRQAIKAAEEGTRIHRAIEAYFDGKNFPDKYIPHIDATLLKLRELFPNVNDWISEKTFAHSSGFGGSCDLHSPSTGICIDYKGKDGDFTEVSAYDGKPKKLAWDQHWQLAAYQVGLRLVDPFPAQQLPNGNWMYPIPDFRECANIFISRTHPGCVASHVWSADEMAQGWGVFEAALTLWKRLRGYDGSF